MSEIAFDPAQLIYSNPLACENDIASFILEGQAKTSFPNGCLRLENAQSAVLGQKANYVLWCDRVFPADFALMIRFRPVREPGLAMLFFSASGRNGQSLFDPGLSPRTGEYPQYHHGDINAFHLSFFRRKEPDERAFHTCNLRKSYGFHLVAQGADPIPGAADAADFYSLTLIKQGSRIGFSVNDLEVLRFEDDGSEYGPLLGGGCIGLRQLAPMAGEYKDLMVYGI
ncbi:MAG: YesU family protein [Clostridiales bacterium]|nr:YesU family protein [Clostridiales bacterium]